VERCRTDDLMPNVPISCLPPVDPKVQGLKVIIACPQPGSSRVTHRPPPISRWSKCGSNDTVMVLLGSGTSKVSKETQAYDASYCIVSSDVSPWPWPWSLRPKSKYLALWLKSLSLKVALALGLDSVVRRPDAIMLYTRVHYVHNSATITYPFIHKLTKCSQHVK